MDLGMSLSQDNRLEQKLMQRQQCKLLLTQVAGNCKRCGKMVTIPDIMSGLAVWVLPVPTKEIYCLHCMTWDEFVIHNEPYEYFTD